jgi:hypothetical protein
MKYGRHSAIYLIGTDDRVRETDRGSASKGSKEGLLVFATSYKRSGAGGRVERLHAGEVKGN